jgi:UDP:flavonoid glycosyltransferase YjiC (YdhE family)
MHALLMTAGSGGDVYPFLQLGKELKARGHRCTLMTHCVYDQKASLHGLDFVPIDTPAEYHAFVEDQPLLNTPRGIPQFLKRHALSNVSILLDQVARRVSDPDTVLLTRDLFDTAPRLISETLGLPLIWIFTAPSQITTASLRSQLFSTILAADIEKIRSSLGLDPRVSEVYWRTYANISIALWPEWFGAPERDWPSPLAFAGFMVEEAEKTDRLPLEIEAILANRIPPILITAGTGSYLGGEFHAASARACFLLNRPGIVVSRYQSQMPAQLPDSVYSAAFLPFRLLMPRIGAVIHHGGIGTSCCALFAGIPQLVLPMGADRPDNAERLNRLGVAEYLPPSQWKPDLIAEALRRLLESSVVSDRCKELAARLQNCDVSRAACDVLEKHLPQLSATRAK